MTEKRFWLGALRGSLAISEPGLRPGTKGGPTSLPEKESKKISSHHLGLNVLL